MKHWYKKGGNVWCYRSKYGYCYMTEWDEVKDKPSKEVHSLIELYPTKKRKGYGTKIVKSAIKKCKELGVKRIAITVRETKEARCFWKTFGIINGKGYIEVNG